VASIERTAYPRFKRAVPVRELDEAFTPAAGEIAWARELTRTPEHLLALVVLLKSCRVHPSTTHPLSRSRLRIPWRSRRGLLHFVPLAGKPAGISGTVLGAG
jgi:uncharacterized protein DUF4158